MPIAVTCTCGKQLRVKDEHAGKKVKCPDCAAVVAIPAAPAEAPPAPAPPPATVPVVCDCGKKLAVKSEHAGKKVKCPACQKVLEVPKKIAEPLTSSKAAEPQKPQNAGETLHGLTLAPPATIPVTCACGKKFPVKSEHAGKKVKCPACQKVQAVPVPETVEPPWVPAETAPVPANDSGFDFSSFNDAPAAPAPTPLPPPRAKAEAPSPPPPPPEPAAETDDAEEEKPRPFKEKREEGSSKIFVAGGLVILVLLFIPLLWLLFFRDTEPAPNTSSRPTGATPIAEQRPPRPEPKTKPPEPKEEPRDLVLPLPIPKLGPGGDGNGDVPVLIKQLDDPAAAERRQAAVNLGRIGDAAKPAIPKLEQTLADEDPDVALQAALALVQLGTVQGLVKGLKAGEARVRIASAMGLATERVKLPPQIVPMLAAALKDKESKVRAYAAAALWKMEVAAEPAEAALVANLKDPGPTAKLYAVMALAYTVVTRDDAVAPLTELLADPATRAPAAASLAKLGPKAAPAVPQLTPLLQDPLPGIRINAAIALGAIGPEARSAVPALAANLKDPSPLVRTFTLRALAKLGPAAQEAVPAILPLLKEPSHQSEAAETLKKIDPAAAQKAGVP